MRSVVVRAYYSVDHDVLENFCNIMILGKPKEGTKIDLPYDRVVAFRDFYNLRSKQSYVYEDKNKQKVSREPGRGYSGISMLHRNIEMIIEEYVKGESNKSRNFGGKTIINQPTNIYLLPNEKVDA